MFQEAEMGGEGQGQRDSLLGELSAFQYGSSTSLERERLSNIMKEVFNDAIESLHAKFRN